MSRNRPNYPSHKFLTHLFANYSNFVVKMLPRLIMISTYGFTMLFYILFALSKKIQGVTIFRNFDNLKTIGVCFVGNSDLPDSEDFRIC